MSRFIWMCVLLAPAIASNTLAQNDAPPAPGKTARANDDPTLQTDADWIDARWQKTDLGQFLCWTIDTPGRKTAHGIAIKIGANDEASVCFDTDLLRYSAGWSGGFLQLSPQRYGLIASPKPKGEIQFTSSVIPGWGRTNSFADPRGRSYGSLPHDWAHYRGLYASGKRTMLSYTAGNAHVLDSPWYETRAGIGAFSRTLAITNAHTPLTLHVCDTGKAGARVEDHGGIKLALFSSGDTTQAVALIGTGAALEASQSAVRVRVEPADAARFQILIWRGARADLPKFAAFVKDAPAALDLSSLTRGGASRWTQPVTTRGTVGLGTGPLVTDTLTVPHENPWNALMFTSGHDFFSNGDIAVSTAHGDVWRVSGVDAKLQKLTWKRFATGLYQPLGLKVIDDKPYVLCRDQIVRLHDLNGDGEADFYENFNNDVLGAGGGHSYTACLETDAAGNFCFVKCAEDTPHGGTLLRVSKDGSRVDVIATGFRNPNGMGIGPGDVITAADQQGEWVPETRLDVINSGGFYGYMPMHKRAAKPVTYDPPLCWITRTVDNSAGGQVWAPRDQWGVFGGNMIHLSYGRCTMMMVLRDEVNPAQGAVVPLPGRFLSGVMRGRFNPHDSHLYLTGLRGWQTAAIRDGCLQRVRYTGQAVHLPVKFAAHANGILLTFSQPLDRAPAETPDSFAAKQWNFRWTERYGSPDYSVRDSARQGRDELSVRAARLGADARSVFIEIADLRPAMQTELKYNLRSADGKTMRGEVYLTIHQLAGARN